MSASSVYVNGKSDISERIAIVEAFETFAQNKMLRQDKELCNLKKVIKGFEQFQITVDKKLVAQQNMISDLKNKLSTQKKDIADVNKNVFDMNAKETAKEAVNLKMEIREMERKIQTYKERLNVVEGISGNESVNVVVSPVTPALVDFVEDVQCKALSDANDDSSGNDVCGEPAGTVALSYMQGAQPDCSSDYRMNEAEVKTSEGNENQNEASFIGREDEQQMTEGPQSKRRNLNSCPFNLTFSETQTQPPRPQRECNEANVSI